MEDNAFDKLKSMVNSGNIPENLQKILSNINSSDKNTNSSGNTSSISPEAINNLINMLNSRSNDKSENATNSNNTEQDNSGIDFETIMKFKTIMDKMNSKDDPRAKLLISLKPYLKDSRKNKIDQYIQFFKMSQVIDIFSKSNGDDR